jgi:cell division protein FtsQ
MATVAFLLGTIAYGVVRGDHVTTVTDFVRGSRDATANAFGFSIDAITIDGRHQLSDAEILASAGITDRNSLLFLDAQATRARLKSNPWIAEATVRKFYPGRLHILIEERAGVALWQKDGQVTVISADGTSLGPLTDRRFASLPLVVGPGAQKRASYFLALLERYPALNEQVRASILVAERRWNLKLKNGLDVRLPEINVEAAFEMLLALDRDKKLLTRDITAVDLRLPDRVTVRLSEEAARARDEAMKPKKQKKKGGDA